MRDDLLDAKSAVVWAVSKFPSLQMETAGWLSANVTVIVKETDAPATHDVIVAIEKEPLPFEFSIEAGAYINVIRSALDILAVAIGKRHGITRLNRVYFPIVDSEQIFRSGKYKGAELVEGIPAAERAIIESLKPYRGGNDTLWALHHLDITRKHHRLLAINHAPARFGLMGAFRKEDVVFPRTETGYLEITGQGETVMLLIAKGAAKPKINYTPEIFLAEPEIGFRKPALAALDEFASLASSIIDLFDD